VTKLASMLFSPPCVSVALCSSALPVYDCQFGCASVLSTYVRLRGCNFCRASLVRMLVRTLRLCLWRIYGFIRVHGYPLILSREISASGYFSPGLKIIVRFFHVSTFA
jgi:hypothetical protein